MSAADAARLSKGVALAPFKGAAVSVLAPPRPKSGRGPPKKVASNFSIPFRLLPRLAAWARLHQPMQPTTKRRSKSHDDNRRHHEADSGTQRPISAHTRRGPGFFHARHQ